MGALLLGTLAFNAGLKRTKLWSVSEHLRACNLIRCEQELFVAGNERRINSLKQQGTINLKPPHQAKGFLI